MPFDEYRLLDRMIACRLFGEHSADPMLGIATDTGVCLEFSHTNESRKTKKRTAHCRCNLAKGENNIVHFFAVVYAIICGFFC